MKKLIAMILTVILLATTSTIMNSTDVDASKFYASYVYNCKKSAPIRKSASGSAKVLKNVPYGKFVTWNYGVNKKNGFYNVTYGGKTGWIDQKYCTWRGNGLSGYATYTPYKAKSATTLRKSKSTSSKKIASIPKSAIVFSKTYDLSGKWIKVKYKTKSGYVKTSGLIWVE